MARDFQISDLCSLNFDHTWRLPQQVPANYVQRFLPYDRIRVQFSIRKPYEFEVRLTNLCTGTVTLLAPSSVADTSETDTFDVLMNTLPVGSYLFEVYLILAIPVRQVWAKFCVVDSIDDEQTILLTYNHYRNDFNTIFRPGDYWDYRVEGIFLPAEKTPSVEVESFRDQRFQIHQLSAFPYLKEMLTIGGRRGVPVWAGDKLNRILSLSFVQIDGVNYVRSEDAAPAIVTQSPAYPLVWWKTELEKDRYFIEDNEAAGAGDFNNDYNEDYLIGNNT